MRIIWLKSDYVIPPDSGGKIRTYNLLRELNRLCEVEYVSFKAEPTPNTEPLMQDCARRTFTLYRPEEVKSGLPFYLRVLRGMPSKLPYIVQKYRDPRFLQYQREACGQSTGSTNSAASLAGARSGATSRGRGACDDTVIVCDFLEMAENVAWNTSAPKVLFQHNVESVIWDRYYATETHPLKKAYFNYERQRMARYESAACNKFDLVLTVTDKDRDRLQHEFQVQRPIEVIETGVDVDFFQPRPEPVVPGRLLFLGSLDWMPNIDGMKWFVGEVYPLIRQRAPHVTLQIVGRRPDPSIVQMGQEDRSIEVIGNVADVRPYVAQSDLFIVPLRVGGGSRLKIFEAMAMRKPIVSTTIGAEGLPLTDQVDIALGDTPVEFAQQVTELLEQNHRKEQLAESGYRLVTENYPWHRIAKGFHDRCQRLIQKQPLMSQTVG